MSYIPKADTIQFANANRKNGYPKIAPQTFAWYVYCICKANNTIIMKHSYAFLSVFILFAVLSACNNASHEAKEDAEELSEYVDSVSKVDAEYTSARWNSIDSGYQARLAELKLTEANLSDEEKAKAEETKNQYETIKVAYKGKIQDAQDKKNANDYRMILRTSLFGEGKLGTDMQFNFVNAQNILSVYENFVNTVADNKEKYTREDWDEIKVLYEALDTRKNEVEKDLDSKDNFKIAKLKIKFATIKALNRGGEKGKENEKAKEEGSK